MNRAAELVLIAISTAFVVGVASGYAWRMAQTGGMSGTRETGMINKVIIVGNLGQDPETIETPSGTTICKFSVATSEKWKDKNTGESREATEWHRVVTFDRLAQICGTYLNKGKQVYIEGKITTRKWEDKDGNRRWTTEIIAHQMKMLGQKGEGGAGGFGGSPKAEAYDSYPEANRTRREAPKAQPRHKPDNTQPDYDDNEDLPF